MVWLGTDPLAAPLPGWKPQAGTPALRWHIPASCTCCDIQSLTSANDPTVVGPAPPTSRWVQIHWLRIILDEGHMLGTSLDLTNKLALACALRAERR